VNEVELNQSSKKGYDRNIFVSMNEIDNVQERRASDALESFPAIIERPSFAENDVFEQQI